MYISLVIETCDSIKLHLFLLLVELKIPYMLHYTKKREPNILFSEDRSCINDIITTYSSIVSGKPPFF